MYRLLGILTLLTFAVQGNASTKSLEDIVFKTAKKFIKSSNQKNSFGKKILNSRKESKFPFGKTVLNKRNFSVINNKEGQKDNQVSHRNSNVNDNKYEANSPVSSNSIKKEDEVYLRTEEGWVVKIQKNDYNELVQSGVIKPNGKKGIQTSTDNVKKIKGNKNFKAKLSTAYFSLIIYGTSTMSFGLLGMETFYIY